MLSGNRIVRSSFVVAIILGLCFGGTAVSLQAATPQGTLTWHPCYSEYGPSFECTTAQVPLDYDKPYGSTISIALVRLRATTSSQRIGSLFFNPGGPGGSGVDFVLAVGETIPADIRASFDIVGFDPRGIARSTPLTCFADPSQWYTTPFAFPTTPQEELPWKLSDLSLVSLCRLNAGPIIDHMSTADVARDLDRLRQMVGDAQLNFIGYSYGTYLGITYANLFPTKVRSLVLDGVVDPIEWATGRSGESNLPVSVRLRSDAGSIATLREFFRLCDAGGANCAFAPSSSSRFDALAARLKQQPITITLPDGTAVVFNYSVFIANTLAALYNSYVWPDLAQLMALLEANAPANVLGIHLKSFWERQGFNFSEDAPPPQTRSEGFRGVTCADTDNPDNYSAWSQASVSSQAQYGYFGPRWTWISSICAIWDDTQSDRYTGPFNKTTSHPALLLNTRYDPATRYENAVTVAAMLPNARLLTVNGWGHTTPYLSQCADQALGLYLIAGILPPQGTVCNQDVVPFTTVNGAVAATSDASATMTNRANLLRTIASETPWTLGQNP